MWIDGAAIVPNYIDPEKSKTREEDVGFAPVPAGPEGRCAPLNVHSVNIPKNAKNKERAYTLAYTVNKANIKTRRVRGTVPCVIIGITLGIMSSFLGIGGGPINLVVLYYFFSMSTKVAAQNSLYIILISQITSVTTTLFTKTVPEFEWLWLVLMVAGGIGGGAVGRKINKKIDDKHVEILFIGLMFTIIGISCYNTWALMK